MRNRKKDFWDELLSETVAGTVSAALFVGSIKYLWVYAAKHYAEDGWILSAAAATTLFIVSVLAAIAGIGALPFWRTKEGKRYALKHALAIISEYARRFRPRAAIPRAVAIIIVCIALLHEPIRNFAWAEIIANNTPAPTFREFFHAFMLSMCMLIPASVFSELFFTWLLVVLPVKFLYLFTQEPRIRRIYRILFPLKQDRTST